MEEALPWTLRWTQYLDGSWSATSLDSPEPYHFTLMRRADYDQSLPLAFFELACNCVRRIFR